MTKLHPTGNTEGSSFKMYVLICLVFEILTQQERE